MVDSSIKINKKRVNLQARYVPRSIMLKYLILSLLFISQMVFACKCHPPSAEMVMDEAEEIFIGKLLKTKSFTETIFEEPEDFVKYTFEVEKSWKSSRGKEIEVTSLSHCSRLIGEAGTRYLIFAYKYKDTLQLACSSKNLDRKPFRKLKRVSDKYDVNFQKELDHISSLSTLQFNKIMSGGISIEVLGIDQEETENTSVYPTTFTSVYINLGSNNGLYNGMDFCHEKEFENSGKSLTVYKVHETYSLAVFSKIRSEHTVEVGEKYKSCALMY
ncbi:hypothetical protein WNY97_17325 [Pseudoalteromonas fuliginea]|uniref:hypothetical protein n=1 Tax=Pseudoalteromonas TaxID=53246 RepID=UPI000231595D|nr:MULTISPECIES: hypothetical protein [unclassified Pseudoalteromonas]ALQ10001.1 hypothetical protein D172_018090 [Pseudoalteromonas sp. Bsw20308]GAA81665.1 hypothetical protein P20495_4205 [Pseudoalteromonas sp. BSi20495]